MVLPVHWSVIPDTPVGRVSQIRWGELAVNTSPVWEGDEPSVNQPFTSTTTSAAPWPLKMRTWPLGLPGTITRLGTVCPAVKLRFDAVGLDAPVGQAVR